MLIQVLPHFAPNPKTITWSLGHEGFQHSVITDGKCQFGTWGGPADGTHSKEQKTVAQTGGIHKKSLC